MNVNATTPFGKKTIFFFDYYLLLRKKYISYLLINFFPQGFNANEEDVRDLVIANFRFHAHMLARYFRTRVNAY